MNKKNKNHMKNKDLEPIVMEKHEGRKLRDYPRKSMNSTHNNMSRGAECICRVMTSPHKDNWRRGHGSPGDGGKKRADGSKRGRGGS